MAFLPQPGETGVDQSIDAIAAQQHGVVTRRQILRLGLACSGIDSRVASGRLSVVYPGVYVVAAAPRTWEQQLLAAWFATAGPISHVAAGVLWDLEGIQAKEPHVIVPHRRRLRLRGVVVHRTRTLERRDAASRGGMRVTTPVRTLIDVAGMVSADTLEDALDDALRRGLVAATTVERRLARMGDRGVRGSATLRRFLMQCRGVRASESALESRFRRRLRKARLPAPVAQHEVTDEAGRMIARVDFAYPEQRLAIEIDGYASHSGRRRWESDLARQNRLFLAGWRLLRFTSTDVDGDGSLFRTIGTMLNVCGDPELADRESRIPKNG